MHDEDMDRQCYECNGDDSISGNKLMFCSNCSRNFHQLCHDPVVDDVWAETVAEWLCHDCIQKYGIQFDADGQELEDSRVTSHSDHDDHSQPSDSGLTLGEETTKTSNRRMEQAVSGIGISYAQVGWATIMHLLVCFTYSSVEKKLFKYTAQISTG
ncbi:hypothetical protein BDF19DRAFT_182400 [Syncephalis fuscata]|nr:hypothetical protein BDF19DRAFT_182400 [Syncephalis fuscata]